MRHIRGLREIALAQLSWLAYDDPEAVGWRNVLKWCNARLER